MTHTKTNTESFTSNRTSVVAFIAEKIHLASRVNRLSRLQYLSMVKHEEIGVEGEYYNAIVVDDEKGEVITGVGAVIDFHSASTIWPKKDSVHVANQPDTGAVDMVSAMVVIFGSILMPAWETTTIRKARERHFTVESVIKHRVRIKRRTVVKVNCNQSNSSDTRTHSTVYMKTFQICKLTRISYLTYTSSNSPHSPHISPECTHRKDKFRINHHKKVNSLTRCQ